MRVEKRKNMSVNSVKTVGMRSAVAVVAMAAISLLAGCASGPAATAQPPEEIVRALAAQRWQALVEGDLTKAYTFATPSYRKINSFEIFRGGKQSASVKWVAAQVLRVDCEPSKCAVQIELESKFETPIRIKTTVKSSLDETWVLEDGKWWMFEKL